ncbi:MAG: hypothetical protein MJZ84_07480 [Paludibacteraceae bacterium]|nr:hypothetical protein [Paludibacteraceae bacterium]
MRTSKNQVNPVFSEKAKCLFVEYPNIRKVYFTTDKMAFFDEREARSHADSLKDKSITTIQK